MAKLRALLIGVAGLLVLALLAAWLVPPMLDWDRYRDNIAVLASAVLGRPVSIAGRVTLTLLPEPTLTATDVGVAGTDGEPDGSPGAGLRFHAQELRLRVALMPLLSGNVAARELVLRRPDIRLPWPLAPGTLSFRRPPWLASVSARLEEGSLAVGDVRFSGIDATLAIGGETGEGGAAAAGVAQRDGHGWHFTARATGSGEDDAVGLDVTLDGQGTMQGLGAVFSGQLAADGTLSGRIEGRGPDLSQVLPAPAVPFHGAGRLTLAAGLAAADDLTLEVGGSPVHGAVTVRVTPQPRLDLALAASRLDLDAWLPVLLRQTGFAWPVGLDLSAEAVQLRGGLLRGLRADFEFDPGGEVAVREAAAVLPGEASLRLDGRIATIGAASPRFTGAARLSAPDLRTTLRWLEASGLAPLTALPADVLRSAELSAEVAAGGDPGQIALHDVQGRVDGAAVTGELGVALGARLAVAARVTVAMLVLDPWLNGAAGPGVPSLADVGALLAPFDADLTLTAPRATWRGRSIRDLAVDAASVGGHLTVRSLGFAMQGVQAQLSGTIGEGGRVTDGRMELTTADAASLGALLPVAWRAPELWHGPCHVQVDAAGPPQALGLRVGVDLADARLEAQPLLNLPGQTWTGSMTLRHPGAPRLLMLMGLPGAGWIGDGSLSLVAQASGGPGRVSIDKFELGAGALHANGQLVLEQGAVRRVSGRVAAETLPLPLPELRTSEPLLLAGLRGWQLAVRLEAAHVLAGATPLLDGVSATLSAADGVWHLDQVSATLGGARLSGGQVSGAAVLDAAAEPPTLMVRAALTGAAVLEPLTGLPLDLAAGRLDGSFDLTASGHSPAALLATLEGPIRLAARDGAVSGFDLNQLDETLGKDPSDAAVRLALGGGSTGFDRLDLAATMRHGNIVLGDAAMTGPSGRAALAGNIDAAAAAIDLRAILHSSVQGGPDVAVRLSGPWTATRRLVELADLTRWRSEQAAK